MRKTFAVDKVQPPPRVCPAREPCPRGDRAVLGWGPAAGSRRSGPRVSVTSAVRFCLLQSRKTTGLRWSPAPLRTGPPAGTPSQTLPRSRTTQAATTSRMPCPACPRQATSLCPTPPSQVSASAGGAAPPSSEQLCCEGKHLGVRPGFASCRLCDPEHVTSPPPSPGSRRARHLGYSISGGMRPWAVCLAPTLAVPQFLIFKVGIRTVP